MYHARISLAGKHNFGVMKTRVVTNGEDMKHVPGAKLKAACSMLAKPALC